MSDEDQVYIREIFKELSDGYGLFKHGLAYSAGKGLCRLWGVPQGADDAEVRKILIREIKTIVASIPDDSAAGFIRLSAGLVFNYSRLAGDPYRFTLTNRRECLTPQFRANEGLDPLPDGHPTRSRNSVGADREKIYDHLAREVARQWKDFASGESFPRDADSGSNDQPQPQVLDDEESNPVDDLASVDDLGIPVRRPNSDLYAKITQHVLLAIILLATLTSAVDLRRPRTSDQVVQQTENPIHDVLDVQVETGAATGSKGGIVFPEEDSVNGHHNLQRSTIKFPLEYYQDALKHGGYMVGGGRIKLKLSTRSDESIEVYKIRPIIESAPMPTGIAIRDVGNELAEDPLAQRAGFLLDAPVPAAQNIRDDGRLMGKISTTWHLTPVSKQISPELVLTFYANAAAYRFSIEVEYILSPKEGTGGQKFSQIINLDGEPFKVAADICMTPENRYKVPNMDDYERLSRLRYNVVAVPDTRPGATSGSYTTNVSPEEFAKTCERS